MKIILFWVLLFSSIVSYADVSKKEYKIGILSFESKEKTLEQYQETASYLSQNIPNSKFVIIPLFYDELNRALETKNVDFVFTNSGDFVMLSKKFKLLKVASIVKKEQENFTSHFGGVMVVLNSRDDINSLEDIKNKKIAAVSKASLGAYQSQAKELYDNKITLSDKQITYTGLPQEIALGLLFEEKVDVAFLRTGLLEELSSSNKLDISKLKVINQQKSNYPFMLSTKLYPEWPLAALAHIDYYLIKQISLSLMSMDHNSEAAVKGKYFGWTIPLEYNIVEDLLLDLKLPPYDKLFEFTPIDIIKKYSEFVFVFLHIIVLVIAYLIFITIKLFKTKKELEINQNKLKLSASVYLNSQNGVIITNKEGIIEDTNRAFTEITGFTRDEIIGKNASMLKSGVHNKFFYKQLWNSIRKKGYFKGEIFNSKKNGQLFPCILGISSIKDKLGNIEHLVGIFTDITQQKKYENELKFLVYHDTLTKLPNRSFLMLRLEQVVAQSKRKNLKFALLTLDLDNFKDINDSYGHNIGDEILIHISKILRNRLRQEDTVFRLGGDEFGILIEQIDNIDDVTVIVRDIMKLINNVYKTKASIELIINSSVGVAIYPNHGKNAKDIFQNSDAALNLAKQKGKKTFAFYSDELTIAALNRVEVEAKLRKAIIKNEFRLYYQPQFCIKTDQLIGCEALIRWEQQDGKIASPIEFISIAEQTGLISKIGEWVIHEASRQTKIWINKGVLPSSFKMSINISAKQFHYQDINSLIETILNLHMLDARYIKIEITESVLVDKEQETILILEKLKKLGIDIALDDFGTGYSSLSYLKKFPIDTLKIDKSFVDELPYNKSDIEIANTIISLGHNFGFEVLAEGVETKDQLEFLKSSGCDSFQGYFKNRPLSAFDFEKEILKNN